MADSIECNDGRAEALGCPFMDLNDPRCAKHFSLARLNEAFSVCLNGFSACQTHFQLQREHDHKNQPIRITDLRARERAHLRELRSELRRTGT